MINFQVFGLCNLLKILSDKERAVEALLAANPPGSDNRPAIFDAEDVKKISNTLSFAALVAVEMELTATAERIRLFQIKVRRPILLYDFLAEVRALRETIEGELHHEYFYRYPKDKARIALTAEKEWKPIVAKFPSIEWDTGEAADCYATSHPTACIFHLMRIVELGLRALARERRVKLSKKLEWADWQTILIELKKKAEVIASKPRGPNRDAALEFYRGALGSIEGFKDEFRNHTMHVRKRYIEEDALRAMRHVHSFMQKLATRLDETSKKQIAWGVRK